jgi:ATP-dependent Lon protease
MIPLRGIIAFPTTAVTFDVGRDKSVNAIERAMEGDRRVFSVAQRDASNDQPHMGDVYQVGTIITVKQLMRLPDGTVRVFADGVCRALLTDIIEGGEIQIAEIYPVNEASQIEGLELTAYTRVIRSRAGKLARTRALGQAELTSAIAGERDPAALCDLVAANLIGDISDKQSVLECMDIHLRLDTVLKLVTRELELAKIEEKLAARVRENIDKSNHDYYLREQISAIQEELGEAEDEDIAVIRDRLAQSEIGGEARERTERELKRLTRMTMHSPEASVSVNYIEYMLSLPWGKKTEKKVDISKARAVLEADHYGMRDVKDRLLEYLGVRALNPEVRSPIICLVGEPGVGKTSIARSVARALG